MFEASNWVYFLLLALAATSSSLVGIVAVWTASALKPHWAIRCGLLMGMLSLGLIIPAHELVAMFFVQSLLVFAGLTTFRMMQNKPDGTRDGFRFSLLDLLLLTALTALVMAVICTTPAGTWTVGKSWFLQVYEFHNSLPVQIPSPHEITFYLSFGAILAVATLSAYWITFAKQKLWLRLSLAAVITTLAVFVTYYQVFCILYWPIIPITTAGLVSAWLFLTRGSDWINEYKVIFPVERPTAAYTQKTHFCRWPCRLVLVALSLAVLFPVAGTLYFMATPPPLPKTTLPEPNAYGTFVRTGKELLVIGVPDLSITGQATRQSLAAFESKAASVLAEASAALQQECQVPLVYNETWESSLLPDIAALRELARGFNVQGHCAHQNGDDAKSVQCYLNAIRMGKAIARGGLYVDALVGSACEYIGLYGLHEILASLSPEQLSTLADTLRSLEHHDEILDAFTTREIIAAHYMWGWEGRLRLLLETISETDPFLVCTMENAFNNRLCRHRILCIEIALRQYRVKHGKFPDKLNELVPEFLAKLPAEPHGTVDFIYHLKKTKAGAKEKTTYELYSPGPDLRDDGGEPNQLNDWIDDVGFWDN